MRPDERAKVAEGAFELSFPEIVKFVEKNFRTLANKKNRAIAGLSMGSFHSCNISKYYPDMFDYVGLFSGASTGNDKSTCPVYTDFEGKLKTQFAKNRLFTSSHAARRTLFIKVWPTFASCLTTMVISTSILKRARDISGGTGESI